MRETIEHICRTGIPGYDPWKKAECCWFDGEAAQLAVDFFPECLRHVEGGVAGKPFVLERWQQAIVGNLFGWKRKDGKGRVVRRYREAFIYVPRKNGKTPLVAGIGLYVFFCDEEKGQQGYIAAADREQAGALFRHAKGMVDAEPELSSRCRIYGGNAAGGQSRSIVRESDGSFLRVISADANSKHGGNPHLIIIDELHAQKDPELYDVLHTGMASENRAQPLFVSLTTADYDRDSVCNERHKYACDVRDGGTNDLEFLPVVYEAVEDKDDWTAPATWAKANPNIGVSVSEDYLRKECEKAQQIPRLQNTFKRLHLNMRTRQDVLWLPVETWGSGGGDRLELPASATICGGVDLSSRIDITALAWVWRVEKKLALKVRFWVPEERIRLLDRQGDRRYALWADEGWIEPTPGDSIDYEWISAAIRKDSEGRCAGMIGYDPWNAKKFADDLHNDFGFDMIEVRQGYVSLNEPSKEFERLIVSREIIHENNPALDWMIASAKTRPDPAGNIKPVKPDPNGKEKIDGVVAAIMALAVEMRCPQNAYPELIAL